MKDLQYPLHFRFKVTSFANDFTAVDAAGNTIYYVREKIFTFRDRIMVYRDQQKTELLYELVSNKLIDFQQTFTIYDAEQRVVGKVRRKTIRSLWRSTFNLMDPEDRLDHSIKEKNPWTKFFDGLFGELPLIGMLSGYVFNPSYILRNDVGEEMFEIKKEPSFFGRKFTVHKITTREIDDERFVLSLMLMVIMERSNG
ncbi:LURP-one-related family protein [Sphingobacterium lactis]|uniref:LURP-one-related n=1 Tax=Sphingobacterium lactis TaxID=797291 RepID=A0A1H5U4Q2_9SPHI|nr:LURP-one-related family protein [Sphingobacterium lactis]SEF70044.1 LURP-one-related [Sphingobacterium lactis]